MVDQQLLTIFVAVTAVAVLIQTGLLVGFYLLSQKLSRQADRAIEVTRSMVGPVHSLAENVQTVSARMAELGASMQGQLRQFELYFGDTTESLRERFDRWRRRSA